MSGQDGCRARGGRARLLPVAYLVVVAGAGLHLLGTGLDRLVVAGGVVVDGLVDVLAAI